MYILLILKILYFNKAYSDKFILFVVLSYGIIPLICNPFDSAACCIVLEVAVKTPGAVLNKQQKDSVISSHRIHKQKLRFILHGTGSYICVVNRNYGASFFEYRKYLYHWIYTSKIALVAFLILGVGV